MKKIYIFLLLIGVGFGCSAQLTKIQVDKLVQAQVADSCNISARVPREQNLPNGAVSQLNRKGFFVGDPLPKEWGSGFNELSIAFSCNPAEELDRPQTWGILGAKSQRWIKNPESMRKELKASTNAYERNLADRIIATTNIYDIRAVNSHGWVETFEDLTGDERFRKRSLVFCLFESSKVLCGRGDVAYLNDGKRGDLTPIALKIIQSIEFLPDVKPSTRDVK